MEVGRRGSEQQASSTLITSCWASWMAAAGERERERKSMSFMYSREGRRGKVCSRCHEAKRRTRKIHSTVSLTRIRHVRLCHKIWPQTGSCVFWRAVIFAIDNITPPSLHIPLSMSNKIDAHLSIHLSSLSNLSANRAYHSSLAEPPS